MLSKLTLFEINIIGWRCYLAPTFFDLLILFQSLGISTQTQRLKLGISLEQKLNKDNLFNTARSISY